MQKVVKRDETMDLMKGICIVFVVVRHARAPYSSFFLLFHMAVFFMVSGYLFNNSTLNSCNDYYKFVVKKIRGLWIPFVGFTLLFLGLNNVFLKINVYTNNPMINEIWQLEAPHVMPMLSVDDMVRQLPRIFLLNANTEMGGALWFLSTLFYTIILYGVVRVIIKKVCNKMFLGVIRCVFSLILLLLGAYLSAMDKHYYGIERVFSAYWLVDAGCFLKEKDLMNKKIFLNVKVLVSLIIVTTIILHILGNFGVISFVDNEIVNPVFFICVSMLGWLLTYCIAKLIFEKNFRMLKRILCMCGKNSLWIVALHFLAFKIVNVLVVNFYDLPLIAVAGFPVTISTGGWWIIYTIVGICVPLVVSYVFNKLKRIWEGMKKVSIK